MDCRHLGNLRPGQKTPFPESPTPTHVFFRSNERNEFQPSEEVGGGLLFGKAKLFSGNGPSEPQQGLNNNFVNAKLQEVTLPKKAEQWKYLQV